MEFKEISFAIALILTLFSFTASANFCRTDELSICGSLGLDQNAPAGSIFYIGGERVRVDSRTVSEKISAGVNGYNALPLVRVCGRVVNYGNYSMFEVRDAEQVRFCR